MRNRKTWQIITALSIAIFILALDLLTKGLIIKNLIPNSGDRIDVLPGFIDFVYVQNYGAAWGILGGRSVFLIILTSLVLALLVFFYINRMRKTKKASFTLSVCFGLVVGGALGNLFDRIFIGYVRDFINFQFIKFPVFNFADISLTFGTILLLVYFVFLYSKEQVKEDADSFQWKNLLKIFKKGEKNGNSTQKEKDEEEKLEGHGDNDEG